jgi:transcriptional regulator with XRE-family HTH domain
MKEPSNPLSEQLRLLRKQANLSGAEAAERAGMSPAKISRVETGTFMPTVDQVATLCRVYKAPSAVRRELLEMIRELRESTTQTSVVLQRGGWQMQQRIGRIEAASELVRSYSSATVTGLLQTESYITAIMSPAFTGENLERTVAARLQRQELLDTQRTFRLIMSEGALRWNVGGPTVMADQLAHLIDVSLRENVRLGVIPWTTTTGLPGGHAFHVYDTRAIIVGTMTATAIMTKSLDVADYLKRFDQLEAVASFDDDARAVIERVAGDYRSLT